jgi:photosynthetic reaction center cytochrome c subunit
MRIAILSFCLIVTPVAVAAESGKTAEQQFKNIVVFKGVPAAQIDPTMDVMSGALGVGCDHCHVKADKPGVPWPMEKDDKAAKRTARKMVTMMESINKQFFGGDQVVTCATCHNGRAEPRSVPPLEHVATGEPEPGEGKVPALTVKQLLDKWVQASGGAAAWGKLKTRVTKETVELPGRGKSEPMASETVQAAPDRWHAQLTMKEGTFEQGWDGKSGWRMFGGHALPLESVAEVQREAQFAPPLTLAKLLTGLKVIADKPLGKDSTAHVIEGRQGELRVRLFFDAKTGLLSRMTIRQPTPAGDLPEQIDYADYRVVDGVKLPFSINQNRGGEQSIDTVTEIKHNTPVEPAQFTPPKDPAAGK